MKLYTTTPTILTLLTWVCQNKLAFGQTPHAGCLSGSGPRPLQSYSVQPHLQLAAKIGPEGRLRVFLIESCMLLHKKALCRQL